MGNAVSQGLWGVHVTDGPLNIAAGDIHNHTHYHRVESASNATIPSVLESIPNFRVIHIATLGRATPGTGLWIVDCESFRLWLGPEGWLRIMWGYGMPGAGKTIAASIVINALEVHAHKSTSSICVCYIYFRYSDHTKATTRSFLEVLVKQTVERHTGCLPLFNETYSKHIREETQPTEEELLGLLRQFTSAMVTFYILDALDEAPTAIQLEIIEKLASLNVKLFITSRPLKNVEAAFPNVHRFSIMAQASDIELHINREISRSGDLRAILERGGRSLQDDIYASIKAKCGGMFLHASLQLAALCECTSVYEVKQTLAAFPAPIEHLYLQTWRRILHQTPSKAMLAKKVLLWVLHVTRSMTVETLEQAIATCPDTYQYEADRLVPVGTLVGVCGGLVAVEEETQLVRLVHYTAKDILGRLLTEAFPHAQAPLSAVCLTRLADRGFQHTAFTDFEELHRVLRAEPLLNYAYHSWTTHAHRSLADPLARDQVSKFIQNCHAFPVQYKPLDDWGLAFDLLGPLHLIAYFNLPIVFAGSSNLRNLNQGTRRRGETALHLACMQGHNDAVNGLLQLPNIELNAVAQGGTTALMWASACGHEGAVRLLLACDDISVNSIDKIGRTALIWASRNGHLSVVTLLLSNPDINVSVRDEWGYTALVTASEEGHEDVVTRLVSHPDVDVNMGDWRGQTALIAAATFGHGGIVKLLLSHSRLHDVNAADMYGWTALSCVLQEGLRYAGTVKLLLSHPQVDVNARSMNRCTPLSWLASRGKEDAIRLLLTHPSIQVGTEELEAARTGGHHPIVCLLEEFLSSLS